MSSCYEIIWNKIIIPLVPLLVIGVKVWRQTHLITFNFLTSTPAAGWIAGMAESGFTCKTKLPSNSLPNKWTQRETKPVRNWKPWPIYVHFIELLLPLSISLNKLGGGGGDFIDTDVYLQGSSRKNANGSHYIRNELKKKLKRTNIKSKKKKHFSLFIFRMFCYKTFVLIL